MEKLRCRKCNNIIKAETRVPRLCPFCGKTNSLENAEIKSEFVDVDELLK